MEEGGQLGHVFWSARTETMGERGDVLSARSVDVEEKSRVGVGCWEGGDGGAFDRPLFGIRRCRVLRGEELGEEWLWSVCGEPPGCRKGNVDFLQAAVRDVCDGCGDALGQRRREGVKVLLEPAKGTGDNHFIEGAILAVTRCECDRENPIWVGRGGDGAYNSVELKIGFCNNGLRNGFKDRFVGTGHEEVLCISSVI